MMSQEHGNLWTEKNRRGSP